MGQTHAVSAAGSSPDSQGADLTMRFRRRFISQANTGTWQAPAGPPALGGTCVGRVQYTSSLEL